MTKRRVVVTGLGAVTPVGPDVASSWAALMAGTSGINTISKFDPEGFSCRIAGEATDFVPENSIAVKELKKMDRFIQMGLGWLVLKQLRIPAWR